MNLLNYKISAKYPDLLDLQCFSSLDPDPSLQKYITYILYTDLDRSG